MMIEIGLHETCMCKVEQYEHELDKCNIVGLTIQSFHQRKQIQCDSIEPNSSPFEISMRGNHNPTTPPKKSIDVPSLYGIHSLHPMFMNPIVKPRFTLQNFILTLKPTHIFQTCAIASPIHMSFECLVVVYDLHYKYCVS